MRHVFLLAAALALPALDPASAAELRVDVEGASSDRGEMHFGLYDKPDGFPAREALVAGGKAAVSGGQASFTFRDLKPGRYAVTVFHDANGNGKFDTTFLGLPDEGYGFSNNAKPFLSAPSFDECAVMVVEPGGAISIRLRN